MKHITKEMVVKNLNDILGTLREKEVIFFYDNYLCCVADSTALIEDHIDYLLSEEEIECAIEQNHVFTYEELLKNIYDYIASNDYSIITLEEAKEIIEEER